MTLLRFLIFSAMISSSCPSANFTQPHHQGLTQSARLLCSKNGTIMRMAFELLKESDTIEAVFTLNYTDSTVNSLGSFDSIDSLANNIIGDGSAANTYSFVLEASCATSPPTIGGSLEQSALLHALAPDSIGVKVMSKYLYHVDIMDRINFANDVVYDAMCNCSDNGDMVLTTNLLGVSGSNEETIAALGEPATLDVYAAIDDLPVTSINLGELVYLGVKTDPSSLSLGTFVYNCDVCDAADCAGSIIIPFIGADGCGMYSFIDEFHFDGSLNLTRTITAFRAFQTNYGEEVFFRCRAQFCYSDSDSRCPNFCAYSTTVRKKRQAVKPEPEIEQKPQSITTGLKVVRMKGQRGLQFIIGADGEPVFVEDGGTSKNTSDAAFVGLVAAVSLAGLLFIVVIVAVVVFFRISRRRDGSEKMMT